MKWLDRLSLSAALANFPTTPARIFFTLLAFMLTTLSYLYLFVTGGDAGIDESVFTVWLGFLSIWAGIDVSAVNIKRKTDYGYVERMSAAGQPPTPENKPLPG